MKKNTNRQTANSSTKGEIRIIAGIWRGRKLPVLNSQGLRPTGDRVKETLFNWLMPYIADACCLDCFTGSGSLGFEALSRRAGQITFLELEKKVTAQLNKNLQTLGCDPQQVRVINCNSLEFLKQYQNQPHFDLVFIDPPFHFDLAEQTITLLDQNNWLKPAALIYVETEKNKDPVTPPDWRLLKQKSGGQVCYRLYQNGGELRED